MWFPFRNNCHTIVKAPNSNSNSNVSQVISPPHVWTAWLSLCSTHVRVGSFLIATDVEDLSWVDVKRFMFKLSDVLCCLNSQFNPETRSVLETAIMARGKGAQTLLLPRGGCGKANSSLPHARGSKSICRPFPRACNWFLLFVKFLGSANSFGVRKHFYGPASQSTSSICGAKLRK